MIVALLLELATAVARADQLRNVIVDHMIHTADNMMIADSMIQIVDTLLLDATVMTPGLLDGRITRQLLGAAALTGTLVPRLLYDAGSFNSAKCDLGMQPLCRRPQLAPGNTSSRPTTPPQLSPILPPRRQR